MSKGQSILKAAWIIAFITIISKLLGFVRDVVVANFFGAGLVSDAYFYAYQIPSIALIIFGGVGGPFHSATVAVFSKLIPSIKEKPSEQVNKLFNSFVTISFLFFVVVAVLCFVFADVIMGFIVSGGSPELIHLASNHLKIMAPIMVVGGIVGIYYGLLVTYSEFLIPNISPIIMSIVIVIVVAITKTDSTGYFLAGATTVGAICQLLFQMPNLRKLGFKIKPNLDFWHNEHLKNIGELLFPAVLSSAVGQIYIYVDMFFASSLPEGAWSAVGYANRIFQFPVGILVTAFLVPLFPLFSRLVAEKDFEGVKTYFNKGIGLLNYIAFPLWIMIILLAADGIKIVFERGAFNADATVMVTEALLFLSVGLIPYVYRDSLTRVFYAFNDSKTPFLVATSSIIIKFILNYFFVPRFGIGGITLSTAFVTLVNGVWLGILIRRKIKMDNRIFFKDMFKMTLTALLTFGICFAIYKVWIVNGLILLLLKTVIMGILCLVVYFLLSFVFKLDYGKQLFDRVMNKVKEKWIK